MGIKFIKFNFRKTSTYLSCYQSSNFVYLPYLELYIVHTIYMHCLSNLLQLLKCNNVDGLRESESGFQDTILFIFFVLKFFCHNVGNSTQK